MLQKLDDKAEAVDHKDDFETEPINKDDVSSSRSNNARQ